MADLDEKAAAHKAKREERKAKAKAGLTKNGMKALPVILEGKPLPRYMGIDAFNARKQEGKRHLFLEQLKEELPITHKKLLNYLQKVPESAFGIPRFAKRLRLDTIGHYREHAVQISTWRAERGY